MWSRLWPYSPPGTWGTTTYLCRVSAQIARDSRRVRLGERDRELSALRARWTRAQRSLGPLLDVRDQLGSSTRAVLAEAGQAHTIHSAVVDDLRDRPCVLVIEELHWADQGTVDLLRFVLRRIATTGSLVVGTLRPDGIAPSHPLRAARRRRSFRGRRLARAAAAEHRGSPCPCRRAPAGRLPGARADRRQPVLRDPDARAGRGGPSAHRPPGARTEERPRPPAVTPGRRDR